MAAPITEIHNPLTEEEEKLQKLEELKTLIANHEDALHNMFKIVNQLNDTGVFEAATSMLQGKEQIAKIALEQVTKPPVTNLINTLMGATGALMNTDAAQSTKLLNSALAGIEEGNKFLQSEKKIGVLDLMKTLNDPDINRAIGFGVNFLKGMGKELKE
ncbi:DUF1641 domain-containing protein [Peribacillus muralis]|uniref:DUF1641 domain-containing protein n=1 Tax=Peribacillus muralis TaxID=264697 RepID=UPI000709454D|nr:DUF1641 domain-containing protein [Peribacillus muralis]